VSDDEIVELVMRLLDEVSPTPLSGLTRRRAWAPSGHVHWRVCLLTKTDDDSSWLDVELTNGSLFLRLVRWRQDGQRFNVHSLVVELGEPRFVERVRSFMTHLSGYHDARVRSMNTSRTVEQLLLTELIKATGLDVETRCYLPLPNSIRMTRTMTDGLHEAWLTLWLDDGLVVVDDDSESYTLPIGAECLCHSVLSVTSPDLIARLRESVEAALVARPGRSS